MSSWYAPAKNFEGSFSGLGTGFLNCLQAGLNLGVGQDELVPTELNHIQFLISPNKPNADRLRQEVCWGRARGAGGKGSAAGHDWVEAGQGYRTDIEGP